MKSFIGIDVRQRQHYATAITEHGKMSFLFTHRPVGFENFSRWIAEVAPLPRVFAVNQNEPFSSAVAAWLRYNGETVRVVESGANAQVGEISGSISFFALRYWPKNAEKTQAIADLGEEILNES